MSVSEGNFKVGDIVWGKVRGYAWWPAEVSKCRILHFKSHELNILMWHRVRNSDNKCIID